MRTTIYSIVGLALAATLPTASAHAENMIQVVLQDPAINGSLQEMHMTLDKDAVNAGQVTFQVTNKSPTLVHELLVLRTDLVGSQLPYDSEKAVFIESEVEKLGEVSDLPPGKSGNLTLDLKPGSYLLACNQPGHTHAGMWTKIMVTP